MKLKELLAGVENFKIRGDQEIEINQVENNSKKVKPNSLFIAIKGFDFDGYWQGSEKYCCCIVSDNDYFGSY